MKNLFGNDTKIREIPISIYCDERKIDKKQYADKESWIYIALLIIPDSKKQGLLETLNGHRENREVMYNHELKFHNLRNIGRATRLAKLWLQEITYNADDRFYFKVLGIKKDNLLFELFGPGINPKGKYANIYNRFFRTAFTGALNLFFPMDKYENILISGFFITERDT